MMDPELRLVEQFIIDHPGDALTIIERIDAKETSDFIQSLTIDTASWMMGQMNRHKAAQSLADMPKELAIKLLEHIPVTTAAIILRLTDQDLQNRLLSAMNSDISSMLHRVLSYPDTLAGAYVDPTVPALFSELNAREGLEYIKAHPVQLGSNIFVIERDQKLKGVMEIMELVKAADDLQLKQIMKTRPQKLNAATPISYLIETYSWDDSYPLLPMVDSENNYLGALDKNMIRGLFGKGGKSGDNEASIAGSALGELLRIGLSGLLQTISEKQFNPKTKP
jgi:Mg/Co/Ni transporter MgtE